MAEHVGDASRVSARRRAVAATARGWRPAGRATNLPCSASLATIVAATPFDTDAQRNTVSGVTFSPDPATRLAIAVEEGDPALLDDPDRHADHRRLLDHPLEARVERGIIDVAALGRRELGQPRAGLGLRRRGALLRASARGASSCVADQRQPGGDERGQPEPELDVVVSNRTPPRPAAVAGRAAAPQPARRRAAAKRSAAAMNARRAGIARQSATKEAADAIPEDPVLGGARGVVAIFATRNWRDVTIDLWGELAGRHQAAGADGG